MPGSNFSNALPVSLTSLIGREQDLAAVCRLLSQDGNAVRLLTLTGVAGRGKTRLAISVGNALAATYPDGVGWVDLSLVMDGRLVARAVANAMQLAVSPQDEFFTALLQHLQSKHQPLLHHQKHRLCCALLPPIYAGSQRLDIRLEDVRL